MKKIGRQGISKTFEFLGRGITRVYPSRKIFEEEWDVLIVLDACRYDLMCDVAREFDYLPRVKKSYSVASKTPVWMEKTFKEEYHEQMAETAYITGNPNSEKFVTASKFGLLDEVWRYAWDGELGTITMEPITDRAISVGRTQDFSRLLIHYMQPHEPFLSAPELGGSDTVERKIRGKSETKFRSVWTRLEKGEISKETVWTHYRENLVKALENIEVLINNLDAEKIVITSDHGNALGEWNLYGHPAYRPIPSLLQVPWVEVSGSDSESHEPAEWKHDKTGNVNSRLRDLGYM